jgi:DNA-binding NtrC family response regulator
MVSLLIIGGSSGSLKLFGDALVQPGLQVITAQGPEEGLEMFLDRRPRIVVVDEPRSQSTRLHLIEQMMQADFDADVILIPPENAMKAVRRGVNGYYYEPLSLAALKDRLCDFLQEAQKRQGLEVENQSQPAAEFDGIVGRSAKLANMFSRIRRVAPHYRVLLITGETGTGKELVARAVHKVSPVSSGRFVVLNCSAVVETLFESELFGHVKGSFTGATQDKMGLFEYAHEGTIFLDEIGDMPTATQAKLLRVLQNQEVQRVGALRSERVNVRVIAATNQDLRALVAAKRFREDLYYRLSMAVIHTPRLVEREEDLPLLVSHFVARFAAQFRKEIRGLTTQAEVRLLQHDWPGNVRELENVIGQAAMMTTTDKIGVSDLHEYLLSPAHRELSAVPMPVSPNDSLAVQECQLITRALESAHGNQTQAARILRITRDRLRYKIEKYNLRQPNSRRARAAAG